MDLHEQAWVLLSNDLVDLGESPLCRLDAVRQVLVLELDDLFQFLIALLV
jgi:hypothetical protein